MSGIDELERLLVSDPFDVESRARYCGLLIAASRWNEALDQSMLLARQQPGRASPLIQACICAIRTDDMEKAKALRDQAKQCDDYAPDPRVEAALAHDEEAQPLRVLAGGRSESSGADVVGIWDSSKTRFSDIVGMDDLKKRIRLKIIEPFHKPELYKRFRKKAGGGILLYGPPGCGKTMIARAIAHECEASLFSVGISDVLDMWIGKSEQNLAGYFEAARQHKPSVLFFDELDALGFSRSKARQDSTRQIVNEFLSQLDGFESDNEQVLILAATNMPWDVDAALKRPGRFDRELFVPPPDDEARAQMFRQKLTGVPHTALDFAALASATKRCSGADIDGILDRAKEFAIEDILDTGTERDLAQQDLLRAAQEQPPSTQDWLKTAQTLVKYGGFSRAYKDLHAYLKRARIR